MAPKPEAGTGKFGENAEQSEATKEKRRANRLTPLWRHMKSYCISENEISQLSTFNDLSAFFFSVGSFIGAIYIEAWMFLAPGEMRSNTMHCSAIATGLFFIAGAGMMWKRSGVMKVIISESSEKIS